MNVGGDNEDSRQSFTDSENSEFNTRKSPSEPAEIVINDSSNSFSITAPSGNSLNSNDTVSFPLVFVLLFFKIHRHNNSVCFRAMDHHKKKLKKMKQPLDTYKYFLKGSSLSERKRLSVKIVLLIS